MHIHMHELIVFFLTVIVCWLVLKYARILSPLRSVHDLRQTQAVHDCPTPRLGGIALIYSIFAIALMMHPSLSRGYSYFALGLMPIIAVCLWEDMARPTPAKIRLAATVLSNAFIIASLGIWLPRIGIPGVDPLMAGSFGIFVTVLIVSGVTNAFNMVDGLNGLCSGIALAAFLAINAIASDIGYSRMVHLSMMYAVAVLGFMLFNFPRARLYLGDTGAYLLGFALSWFGIAIVLKSDSVSTWAFFLIFCYPVVDMLFSIVRRVARRRGAFLPDAEHFHHLVLRNVRRSPVLSKHGKWHNPIATALILPLAIVPMIYAARFYDDPGRLVVAASLFVLVYLVSYAGLYLRGVVEPATGVASPAE